MRISDWSSDVCSSDLHLGIGGDPGVGLADRLAAGRARQGLVAVADADAATEVETLQRHPRRAQFLVERDQAPAGDAVGCDLGRTEERRVGKACVSKCISRRSPSY